MKILFYINVLAGGGAERVITNLANYFNAKQYEVMVVNTFRMENEYKLDEGIKHFYLESKPTRAGMIRRNISRIKQLRKLLKELRPDVAISFMQEPNFRLIAASHNLDLKTVVSVRADPVQEGKNSIARLFLVWPLKRANAVVFQTKQAQQYFEPDIVARSRIILNPVNEKFYVSEFSGKRKDIVSVGRLCVQKNHKMLIEAFYAIAGGCLDNLLIYGDGPEREELQKIIEDKGMADRIFLKGNVGEIQTVIKSAKMFVLSSDSEGLPNALMEAMALGIPCIATDCPCGGPQMLIENGENGFLVPVGDVDALAMCMKKLLNLPEKESEAMGREAKKTSLGFKSAAICKKWEEYILSLI